MSRTTAVRPVSAARRATGSAASARPYGTTPGASHSYVTRKPAGVEPVVATTRSTRRALPSSSTVPRNTSSGSSDARATRDAAHELLAVGTRLRFGERHRGADRTGDELAEHEDELQAIRGQGARLLRGGDDRPDQAILGYQRERGERVDPHRVRQIA